jgi:hypothetical protein
VNLFFRVLFILFCGVGVAVQVLALFLLLLPVR